jgi:uncharacterized Zn finger protein (UPF0148 family)
MSGITTVYDCGARGCEFLINEKPPDPALIHKALREAKKLMDKTNIMIPEKPKQAPALRGGNHFCEDSKHDFLELYHCGQHRIKICHFNGVHFATMCVNFKSPLFRNLSSKTYCGACREEDEVAVPRNRNVMFYQMERSDEASSVTGPKSEKVRRTQNSMSLLYEKVQQRKEKARLGQRKGPSKVGRAVPLPAETDLVEAVADLN